jgi:long-chain fatty acid transport protein
MKKFMLNIMLVAAIVFSASAAFASSIDYRGNQSADYIRTLNRNAALDGADLVVYNPAGAAMLEDGMYVNAGLQFLFKTYTMEANASGTEYESDYPSLFLPNLYGIYKQDNWAAFMGFHVPAGGGTVKYEDGTPLVTLLSGGQPNEIKATSIYYGFTAGGAYAVNKMVSLSLAGRIIYATRSIEGKVSGTTALDTEQTATGFGAILGVDIMPIDKLNIGLRYEMKTKLELEADTKVNGFPLAQYNDGAKQRRDLPALLGLGLAFDVMPELKLTAGLTYYFIKQADAGSDAAKDAYDDDYDNGYDASIGAEYKVMPELLLSLGYMYSDTGANKDTIYDFDMSNDSHNYSLGAKYTVMPNTDLSVGYIYSDYIDLENANKSVTYKKQVHSLALGVNSKF